MIFAPDDLTLCEDCESKLSETDIDEGHTICESCAGESPIFLECNTF